MSSVLSQTHTAGHGVCVSQAPLQRGSPTCGQCGALSPAPSSGTSTFGPGPRWVRAARGLFLGDRQGVRVELRGPHPRLSPAEMLGRIPQPADPPLPGAGPPSPPSSPPGLAISALSWDRLPDGYMSPRPYSGSAAVRATAFHVFDAMAAPAARGQP